ncbi:ABC transporter substrate-binding protein [soil metagenome]
METFSDGNAPSVEEESVSKKSFSKVSNIQRRAFAAAGAAFVLTPGWASAQKKYDPGATDAEIKLGHTNPYSGPASAYGTIGKAIGAYWRMVNDQGGVNGRQINFITYDDGFSPPKTVEMVRKLVEADQVFSIFQLLGTATNTVVQKYLNQKKVPQLFIATGASKWGMPKEFPWTMGWHPDYDTEAAIYAKHIMANHPKARVAMLYQNDDSGKDYLHGFQAGFGKDKDKFLIKTVSYEVTDPTVDSQIIQLKDSGADVLFIHAVPKQGAQAIRKVADLDWKPVRYLANVAASVASTLKPAGLEASKDIITAAYLKDATDSQWANDADFKEWQAWMKQYVPEGNPADSNYVYAYAASATMRHCLAACGDTLTRANLMKQAASLRNVEIPLLLPGIRLNTSATDFYPIQAVRLARFDGETWRLFGEVLSNEST